MISRNSPYVEESIVASLAKLVSLIDNNLRFYDFRAFGSTH